MTRGLLGCDDARCTVVVVAGGSLPGPGLGLVVAERLGLRSILRFREREETREVEVDEVELRRFWEERVGEGSREDIVEFVADGGPEAPGTGCEGLGNCERKGTWPWDLVVERGSSLMSPSLADLRVRDEGGTGTSSWAALGPPPSAPPVPLG
jgi:hypothetical protein